MILRSTVSHVGRIIACSSSEQISEHFKGLARLLDSHEEIVKRLNFLSLGAHKNQPALFKTMSFTLTVNIICAKA